ncbi:MAG: acetyl-CoA carboxylase biotin carboxyl carrier protein subunit [Prolixibacteraceae bacterium]|nr:acetyl-CoA carboxylase biotin carboxyl carrier protein subunit [Prolixibacteraceae bacterium]MBN2773944.1 acetyl-CoA carboxylase biotin carboxyl carrier protein subunit [Prolixibacteraceae bacterium]
MKEQEDLKTLIIEGAVYKTTFTKKFENRTVYEAPDRNKIFAFMPGTIIDIFVKKGDKVEEGQSILILEAMKMHNNVTMPFNGQIVKIHVKRDDVIPKNHLMLEIKPI